MFQYLRQLLVLIVCSVLMVGCGKAKNEDGRTVLRLWHIMNYSGPQEVLEAAVADFEAAHPGVTVEVETFSNDDYKTKLALEMSSGNEPDVFFNWGAGGQTGQYIAQGKVLDMTDYAKENGWGDRFIESAAALCRKDGRLYCAPLDLSVVVLWCNGSLFTKYGVKIPTTWEELLKTCEDFQGKDANISPLALGNIDAWPGAFYFCYLANRLGGTALFEDAANRANGHDFADAAFVTAGKMLQTLVERKAFNVDFLERKEDEARKLFVRGRAAMYLGGSWLVGQTISNPDNAEFMANLIPVTFPAVADGKGDKGVMLGGVNCGFSVAASSRNQQLALELVNALTSAKTAEAWCRIGRMPAVKTEPAWRDAFPPATRNVYNLLTVSTGLQPYYDQYLPAAVTVEHKNTTKDLFAKRTTPEEAAAKMKVAMETATK